MNTETERKFLLSNDSWRESIKSSQAYRQGYIKTDGNATVRVRTAGEKSFLTLKSTPRANGLSRLEFEYEIPAADAEVMLDELCAKPLVEKIRHIVYFEDKKWEIDEFSGENTPLVLAEIELESIDAEFARPPWLGREVTNDGRYYNSHLVTEPYRLWGGAENS